MKVSVVVSVYLGRLTGSKALSQVLPDFVRSPYKLGRSKKYSPLLTVSGKSSNQHGPEREGEGAVESRLFWAFFQINPDFFPRKI